MRGVKLVHHEMPPVVAVVGVGCRKQKGQRQKNARGVSEDTREREFKKGVGGNMHSGANTPRQLRRSNVLSNLLSDVTN